MFSVWMPFRSIIGGKFVFKRSDISDVLTALIIYAYVYEHGNGAKNYPCLGFVRT